MESLLFLLSFAAGWFVCWVQHNGARTQQGLIQVQCALRAVVELHKSDKEGFCAMNCVEMDDDGYAWTQCAYPCPTIQAIEKALNE